MTPNYTLHNLNITTDALTFKEHFEFVASQEGETFNFIHCWVQNYHEDQDLFVKF